MRLGTVDGEPAALEFDAGGVERAVFRIRNDPAGRIRELRIDHRPAPLVELAGLPEPAA